MGFNTVVLIRNDGWAHLQENAQEAIDGMYAKMREGGEVAVGTFCNPITVMPTSHADVFRLFANTGNTLFELSPWARDTRDFAANKWGRKILRQAAKEAKYNLKELEKLLKEIEAQEKEQTKCKSAN